MKDKDCITSEDKKLEEKHKQEKQERAVEMKKGKQRINNG